MLAFGVLIPSQHLDALPSGPMYPNVEYLGLLHQQLELWLGVYTSYLETGTTRALVTKQFSQIPAMVFIAGKHHI